MRQLLIAAVAGGLVTIGAAGYLAGATGAIDLVSQPTVELPGDTAAYYACPGTAAMGRFHRGDRVLVTGTDESGTWFEVRSPVDLLDRVWVVAASVSPTDTVTDVPVVECGLSDEEIELATGETVPLEPPTTTAPEDPSTTTTTRPATTTAGPTTTVGNRPADPPSTTARPAPQTTARPAPTTTARPPVSTTRPTTTAPPPAPKPSIGNITAAPNAIFEQWDGVCGGPFTSTISVPVSNATGATMRWNSDDLSGSKPMNVKGGSASAMFGPFPHPTVPRSNDVVVTITATGPGGTASKSITLRVHDCFFG